MVAALGFLLLPAAGLAGSSPSIAWSPSTYDYGAVTPGQTASHTFTLRNSGGSATGALSVSLSGTGATAFSITSHACTGVALGKGRSCAVTVQFAPTKAGQSYTASLTAKGKKPAGGSASVTLTGSGNLVPNPGFEEDCSGTTGTPCGWRNSFGSNGTISHDTTNPHSGSASANLSAGSTEEQFATSDCFTISPNTTYNISGWYRESSPIQPTIGIEWYSEASCLEPFGGNPGQGGVGASSPVSDGMWTQLSGQVTTGPDAVSADVVVGFEICDPACALGANMNFDDIALTQAP